MDNPCKVISFLNGKGGAGKTMCSINIAHGLKLRGSRVAIIDTDPQHSVVAWSKKMHPPLIPVIGANQFDIAGTVKELKNFYDFLILDGAAKIEVLMYPSLICSDIVLIPVRPDPFDIDSLDDLVKIIEEANDKIPEPPIFSFILNGVGEQTKSYKEGREDLLNISSNWKIPIFDSYITGRTAYPWTARRGNTVYMSNAEVDVKQAQQDIELMIDEIQRKFL